MFFFCVLKCKWACSKVMRWPVGTATLKQVADSFFDMAYHVTKGKIVVTDASGWQEIVP